MKQFELSDCTKRKETCETVYIETNLSHMFNSVLCSFLNISQDILPVKYEIMKENNDWITQGIKISCRHDAVCMASLRTAMIKEQSVLY